MGPFYQNRSIDLRVATQDDTSKYRTSNSEAGRMAALRKPRLVVRAAQTTSAPAPLPSLPEPALVHRHTAVAETAAAPGRVVNLRHTHPLDAHEPSPVHRHTGGVRTAAARVVVSQPSSLPEPALVHRHTAGAETAAAPGGIGTASARVVGSFCQRQVAQPSVSSIGGPTPASSHPTDAASKTAAAAPIHGTAEQLVTYPPTRLTAPRRVRLEDTSTRIQEILQSLSRYFDFDASNTAVATIVEEAYRTTDQVYCIQDALRWAAGFQIPADAIASDYRLFQASGRNFDRMVQRRLKQILPSRLNRDRITAVISPENPELQRLLDLVDGIRVPLPPGFQPNGQGARPPLRPKYQVAHSVVNKLYHELHETKLAFYLPMAAAVEVTGSNFSSAEWVEQASKEQGRQLIDPSDDSLGPAKLNGPTVRDAVNQLYGEIEHPTIVSIMRMIIHFYEREKAKNPKLTWSDLTLWKMDLKGAFTLLSFRPEHVKLFGMELTNDDDAASTFAVFFLCGVFGWTGTPAAFQVVTRAIVWQLRQQTKGALDMFVDDLIGVCLREHLQDELAAARRLCTDLLGEKAVSDKKTEWGQRLDVIGYTIDLINLIVTISRKNFLRALYGFYTVDIDNKVPVKTLERLASWASRYSAICRPLKPFTSALYSAFWWMGPLLNRRASLELPPRARISVRLWRTMLVALHLDEKTFARSFDSFRLHPMSEIIGEFDCSLEGAGILIYRRTPTSGDEQLVGGGAVSLLPLGFGVDSSFQNTAEFIGAILVIVVMLRIGMKEIKICLRGDSISALTWASEERFKGENINNAAIVFISLMTLAQAEIIEHQHIPGEDNWRCDGLSRPSLRKTAADLGLENITIIDMNGDPIVTEILELCDPRLSIATEEDFALFWRRVKAAVHQLIN